MAQRRLFRWLKSSIWADRLLAALALSPLVVLLVRQFMELNNNAVPCCDFASLELGTRAFLRGEQLVGLYSREGWRHPGPAPFLWSSLFRPLPGNSFAEHQVGAALLSLIAVSSVIASAWNRVSTVGRSVLICLVAVFIVRFDIDAMRVPWNPYGAAMWVLICVLSTTVFTQTRSALSVGVAVFAGSMAAQTHVGAAPAVVVCFGVVMWVLFRFRSRHNTSRNIWTAGCIFAVAWFLPLADLAFGNRNLLKILTSGSGSESGLDRSDLVTGAMWIFGNSPGRIGDTFGPSSPFVDARNVILLDIVAIVVVLGLALVALLRWRKDRTTAVLSGLAVSSGILTLAALVVSDSEYLRYLLLPIAGLGLIVWMVAGLTATRMLQRHEHNVMRILAWPVVVALSAVSIVGMTTKEFTDSYVTPDVQSVVDQIGDSCDRLSKRAVIEIDSEIEWFDALPVVVAIERCSIVRVIGPVGFLAGQPYQAVEGALANVFMEVTGGEIANRVIARSDLMTVSVIGE